MALSCVKALFIYVPYVVLAMTLFLYVFRLPVRRRGKAVWCVWLSFCCSKFMAFKCLGGETFVPAFPEKLIWFWNWAYSGAMILGVLSVVLFFRFRWKGRILGLSAWSLSAIGLWSGLEVPSVHAFDVEFSDLPRELEGYRIAQISDLHASSAARRWRTRAVVDAVNATGADLVCLTGDYVDGDPNRYREVLEPLRELKARDGVWAVSGNHEWFPWHQGWWPYYVRMGIRFLANECVFPHKGLALGGVHDFRVQEPQPGQLMGECPDVAKTFVAATNGEFRILLQHQPRAAQSNLDGCGVRLQLSGHTHGGIMPGFAQVVKSSNCGFVRGLYRIGKSFLYVNPGCGQWAGFPMRFFNPSEIAVITLRRGASE